MAAPRGRVVPYTSQPRPSGRGLFYTRNEKPRRWENVETIKSLMMPVYPLAQLRLLICENYSEPVRMISNNEERTASAATEARIIPMTRLMIAAPELPIRRMIGSAKSMKR